MAPKRSSVTVEGQVLSFFKIANGERKPIRTEKMSPGWTNLTFSGVQEQNIDKRHILAKIGGTYTLLALVFSYASRERNHWE